MPVSDPLSPILARDLSGSAERLVRTMARWRRRSRVIRFWRVCLPLAMLAIAGGVLSLVALNVLYGPGRIADQNEEVRMLNPRFLGRDKNGRPYTVTAVDAVKNPSRAELVSLNRPHLVLEDPAGGAPTVVDAEFGLYNENTHILILDRNVRLDDGKLNLVESAHAVVDTDQGTVDGNTPVVATGPKGRTTGRAYKVRDRGADTEFIGDVRSHLLSQ
jgi:lipopolysaccharide export system protein LptC